MKKNDIYRGFVPFQSEFSYRYACWANNHAGWAKMKKSNKKMAKRKEKANIQKEIKKQVVELDI